MNGYKTHAKRIASSFATEPLETFPVVARFALASIQQQFHTVGTILDEWDAEGTDAASCWGMKRPGLEFINDQTAWEPLCFELVQARQEGDRLHAIDLLVQIPGINVVKAAFIAQMVGFETACLDTQNLNRLEIETVAAFHIRPTNTMKTRRAKILAYLKLCDELGTAESFWNIWCEQIALIYPQHFDLDFDVSSCHVEWTIGRIPTEKTPF